MLRTSLFSILVIILASCVGTSNVIPPHHAESIPEDASVVVIKSKVSADSSYEAVYSELGHRGFGFHNTNQANSLTTSPLDIGEGTTVQIRVFVEDNGSGSTVRLRGAWGLTGQMASAFSAGFGSSVSGASTNRAQWTRGRPKRAFAEIVDVAYTVDIGALEFE